MTARRSDLTVRDVALKAHELASANPKFVYRLPGAGHCLYVDDGEGSCLFGRALLALGVPVDVLSGLERRGIGVVLRSLGVIADVDDAAGLTAVQNRQDAAAYWGELAPRLLDVAQGRA